ncbi:polysaccharide deacetylase family protein [Desulfallas sp. Bu1-1]|jgi:peptidoglycan/xylan/chitin deacetylase (PgdA/CDA1 family)|uniref:polysaccharide deacetylase family protein n=1 Tax=Desulfallas sp. Bu1-1 TaxID=2787620 RepID=UPI00189D2C63|nr:polysaccharide deacetylase family protein [Desulfallas sp. Bu1-1]MBF7083989.1 polysaccharide deacetylase family protein [Desulfallas sp. Bu1-1]
MKKVLTMFLIAVLCLFFTSGWHYPAGGKVLLTFDDGPNPLYTPEILTLLQKNNIKATFFVVGQEAYKHPELLAEISRHGHLLGIHTYTHRNITTLSREELQEEIRLTAESINSITGQNPVYFRPPRGKYAPEQLAIIRGMGYTPVKWDACLEYNGINDPELLVRMLLKRIRGIPNPVILLHDGDPTYRHDRTPTVKALQLLINELRKQGYEFADPGESYRYRRVEL